VTDKVTRGLIKTTGEWPLTLLYVSCVFIAFFSAEGRVHPLVGISLYLLIAVGILYGNSYYLRGRDK
jgi:hypothetical protein